MSEQALLSLVVILVLGVGAQWLAWRLGLPSILLLLLFGLAAGPITGLLHPDALFGDLLVPIVGASVSLVLFEGSLTLRLRELREIGRVIQNLIVVGGAVTWIVSTLAARFLLRLDWGLALLLGAILVVTGPTVIGPLLDHIKPRGRVGPTLKWESILIDPIGALLALLVFEAILASSVPNATLLVVGGFVQALAIGVLVGALGAGLMIALLRYYLVPEALQNAVTLTVVVTVYAGANALHSESGLMGVTAMGIILANQRVVTIAHIVEFKENVRVLLLAGLFIVLAARLTLSDLAQVGLGSALFLAVQLLIARPLGVTLATHGSDLSARERAFLAWMAPRGIVAASVSSIFALRLQQVGYPGSRELVAQTFLVIIGTVTVYALTSPLVAQWLHLRQRSAQGVLIVGADIVARRIAQALVDRRFAVLLVDTNRQNVAAARKAGLPAIPENILAEYLVNEIDLEGIGRLFALTPNNAINALAALRFVARFGRNEVYQLPAKGPLGADQAKALQPLNGRFLFAPDLDHGYFVSQFARGAQIKATPLTDLFDYQRFLTEYGAHARPLFLIGETHTLTPFTVDHVPSPQPGQLLLSLHEVVDTGQADHHDQESQPRGVARQVVPSPGL